MQERYFLAWLSILSWELLQMFSHFSCTVLPIVMSWQMNLNSMKCFCSNIFPFLKYFSTMSIILCISSVINHNSLLFNFDINTWWFLLSLQFSLVVNKKDITCWLVPEFHLGESFIFVNSLCEIYAVTQQRRCISFSDHSCVVSVLSKSRKFSFPPFEQPICYFACDNSSHVFRNFGGKYLFDLNIIY